MEKALKRECNQQCAALLIYKLIMTVVVTVTMLVIVLTDLFTQLPYLTDPDEMMTYMMDGVAQAASSGWGYLIAIVIGLAGILLWKKPRFFRQEILKKGRPMGVGTFFLILSLFMSAQLASQLGIVIMDGLFGFLGKSVSEFMQTAGVSTDSLSMLLYVGLGAPIFEEILFRGILMRSLEPYGKKMAIFVSALLFGFYHGNPVQAPYAALVGMVLGYVAMEHNIIWAMVLHMFNNLIFADTIPRLLQNLPVNFQNAVVIGLLVVFALTAAILLIVKRRQVLTYLKEDRIQPWQYNGAFLSPVLLVLVAVCVMDMVAFIGMILITP